jgi:DNA-binding transcriptional LysR family regulator
MIDPSLFPALFSFLAVARTGSVAAAARQQHRTSSAISQQLRRLESHFGVKLLERAGRGVRLTAAAEIALPSLARLWTEAEAFFGELAASSGRPAATVRVAVSDYLGKVLLVPVLRRLVDRRAPVRFEVVTTHSRDALARVAKGDVEFGIVSAEAVHAGLEQRTLFDQAFAWVGPRRRSRRRESIVERLAHEPLLRLGAESHGRRLLDDFLERAGVRPTSTIDVTSVSLMLSYIAGGLGVGLAPTLALHDVARTRIVVERAAIPPTPVKLVMRPSARRHPVSARFADALASEGRRYAGR